MTTDTDRNARRRAARAKKKERTERHREHQKAYRKRLADRGLLRRELVVAAPTDAAQSSGYTTLIGVWVDQSTLQRLDQICGKQPCLGVREYEGEDFRLICFLPGRKLNATQQRENDNEHRRKNPG